MKISCAVFVVALVPFLVTLCYFCCCCPCFCCCICLTGLLYLAIFGVFRFDSCSVGCVNEPRLLAMALKTIKSCCSLVVVVVVISPAGAEVLVAVVVVVDVLQVKTRRMNSNCATASKICKFLLLSNTHGKRQRGTNGQTNRIASLTFPECQSIKLSSYSRSLATHKNIFEPAASSMSLVTNPLPPYCLLLPTTNLTAIRERCMACPAQSYLEGYCER